MTYLLANLDVVMLGVIICVGFLFRIFKPELAQANFDNLVMNAVSIGYNGLIIPMVWFVAIGYLHYTDKVDRKSRLMLVQFIAYIVLIYALMLFSIYGTRVSYGDSSCRMVLHILPIAGIFISNVLSKLHKAYNSRDDLL